MKEFSLAKEEVSDFVCLLGCMVWHEAVGLDNDGMQAVGLAKQNVNAFLIASIHPSPAVHLVQLQSITFIGNSFVQCRTGHPPVTRGLTHHNITFVKKIVFQSCK